MTKRTKISGPISFNAFRRDDMTGSRRKTPENRLNVYGEVVEENTYIFTTHA